MSFNPRADFKKPPDHKLRLLCLHGYSQSASMLFTKTKKLRRALVRFYDVFELCSCCFYAVFMLKIMNLGLQEGTAQLIFVDAPLAAAAKDENSQSSLGDVAAAARRCFYQASECPGSSASRQRQGLPRLRAFSDLHPAGDA